MKLYGYKVLTKLKTADRLLLQAARFTHKTAWTRKTLIFIKNSLRKMSGKVYYKIARN